VADLRRGMEEFGVAEKATTEISRLKEDLYHKMRACSSQEEELVRLREKLARLWEELGKKGSDMLKKDSKLYQRESTMLAT